jgi:maleate cis-trans isomerase
VLGILYPGHSAEDDYPRAAAMIMPAVDIPVIHTTVGVDTHEIEALRDTGAPFRLAEGAERLRPSHPDAVMWACTSGSFVFGLEGAQAQVRPVAEQLGVPVSSTSLAFLSALHALDVRRVAIGATYPDDLTDLFRAFLEADGFQVLQVGTLGIMDAAEGGNLSREDALSLAVANRHPDADVVLLPDTAVHTIAWLDDLQAAAGVPVLTANGVTVWEGLRLLGHPAAVRGPLGFLEPA